MHDYVIVGAGSAGCVLANRLSANPDVEVLLLEAGPPDTVREVRIPVAFSKLFRSTVDWDYTTEPQEHLDGRGVYWPRGRTLGGSSSINAQMYVRGHPADYDHWAALGNQGWTWHDVLPAFQRAEHAASRAVRSVSSSSDGVGADGPLDVTTLRDPHPATRAFLAAAAQAGLPALDDTITVGADGVGQTFVTQRRGQRWSAADAYLRPAQSRPNLTVITGAQATRVLLEGGRATGVAYRTASGERTVEAKREVLLAAGAVNSPQLLMLSGLGPAGHLREHGIEVARDLPGVGQGLSDHLVSGLFVAMAKPASLLLAERPGSVLRFLALRKGMLTSNVAEAHGFTRSDPSLNAPDLQLIFAPVLFENEGLTPPTEHGMTLAAVLLTPASRGQVTLRSADPLAKPRIEPRYLSDPGGHDLRRLVAGVRLCRRIAESPALAAWRGQELKPGGHLRDDDELASGVRATAHTLYHPVGTCRMGTGPGAVVDARLRVHGVRGLRVVDASIMPTIPRGNTNGPTIMIAEKAAAILTGAGWHRVTTAAN